MSTTPPDTRSNPLAAVFGPRRAPDTTSVRVWLTRVVSLTLLLAGNVLLQAAALQPAIIDGTPESRRVSPVLDSTVAYALLAAALMVVSWRSRHDYWRVAIAGALIVGSIAGGIHTWGLVPEPSPAGGLGLRGLLGTYAFGCIALSGLVFLTAYAGRGLFGRWRVLASGLVVVAAVAGVVAVAELWFPPLVVDRNVAATTARDDPPPPAEPKLDGTLSWGSTVLPGSPRAAWYPTAGGLLTKGAHGLQMVDPTTGKVRWSYSRYDVVRVGVPRVSPDGQEVAVTVRRTTTSTVLHRARNASYVWILDTSTGELRSQRLAPVGGGLRAYVGGQLVWGTNPGSARGSLRATDPTSGEVRWKTELPASCAISQLQPTDDGGALLVGTTCGTGDRRDPPRLLRIDTGTGALEWTWEAEEPGQITPAAAGPSDDVVAVQVASPTQPEMAVAGVDLADGTQRWYEPDVDLGMTPLPTSALAVGMENHAYGHTLLAAGDATVLASADGAETRLRLARLDVGSGEITWTATAPLDWPSVLDARLVGLADGRVAIVSRLGQDGDPVGPSDDPDAESELAITTVDAANGTIVDPVTTKLDWTTAQIVAAPSGVVLRHPRDDEVVLVGLH